MKPTLGPLAHMTLDQREHYAVWCERIAKVSRGRMADFLRGAARIARGENPWSYLP